MTKKLIMINFDKFAKRWQGKKLQIKGVQIFRNEACIGYAAVVILFMIFMSGCSRIDDSQRPAAELVKEANESFDSGRYENALKTLENLRDWYPFSPTAPDVELKIADTYFKMESYGEASVAYEEFTRLHPKNRMTPYAVFQAGMCYYNQMDTSDRDQMPGQKATIIFEKIIQTDPDGKYSRDASEKLKKCYQNLATHEMEVAEFYFKIRQYEAALKRYERVVKLYPDVGMHESALSNMKICTSKMEKNKKHPDEEKPIEFPSASQF